MVSGVATTALNTVIVAIAYPVYLHFLGYEKYGVWIALSTVLSFAQLGNLGIGSAVMKLVAEEHGHGETKGIQHYVTTALFLICVSGVAVLTAILVLKEQIIALFRLTDESAQIALWLLPYIGVLSIYVFIVQVFEATLSGLGRMDLANCRGTIARATNVAVSGALLFSGYGVGSLLVGRVVAEIITHLWLSLGIHRILGARILCLDGLDLERGKRLLSFGGAVLGSSLLNMLFGPLNKLLLARYAGIASVPIYEIALTGSMQIRSLVAAGQAALVPEISRVSAEMTTQARFRISQLYRRSLGLLVLLAAPVFGCLALFAPILLKLWLGGRFVETLPGAFRVILLGAFMSVLSLPAYFTLMGSGHVRHNLGAHVVQTMTNLILLLCILAANMVSINVVSWISSFAMTSTTLYLVLQKERVFRRPSAGAFRIKTEEMKAEVVSV
jgi:O-antigen/teichoic acid export membrane protein